MNSNNQPISLPRTQAQTPAVQPQGGQVRTMEDYALAPEALLGRKRMLAEVMQSVMKPGEHYGKIPGCGDKPTLLKPGAEAIASTFQLCPRYQINRTDLQNGHREYEIICELYTPGGAFVGSGVGAGTSMEGKYRFRTGEGESTGIPVPKAYWDNRSMATLKAAANAAGFEGDKFGTKKIDDKWTITTHGERVEHDNPADYYNTVLKMAKKRAFVDATLTATGASDIFTQDIEDMSETIPGARRDNSRQQPPANATNQMDDLPPDYGQPRGQPKDGRPMDADRAHRAVFAACKEKGVDLNALCRALSEADSFGRQIMRVKDLDGAEAATVREWLNTGQLDHLSGQSAA